MSLEQYRKTIDEIDHELVKLLEKRFEVVRKIGAYKLANNLPIHDPKREAYVLESKKALVKNLSDWPYFEKIFKQFMDISKEMEK